MSKRFIYYGESVPSFINDYSIYYDRTLSQGVMVGDVGLLNNSVLSVSAWFKIDDNTTRKTIYSDSQDGTRQRIFIEVNGDTFRIIWGGIVISVPANIIPVGAWQNMLFVRSGTSGNWTAKTYLNGTLIKTDTTTRNPNGTSSLEIGYFSPILTLALFNGNIDEVAVWQTDQSANALLIYNGGSPTDLTVLSPLSWWRMGDGDSFSTNWTLLDNGSNSFDGISSNMDVTNRKIDTP